MEEDKEICIHKFNSSYKLLEDSDGLYYLYSVHYLLDKKGNKRGEAINDTDKNNRLKEDSIIRRVIKGETLSKISKTEEIPLFFKDKYGYFIDEKDSEELYCYDHLEHLIVLYKGTYKRYLECKKKNDVENAHKYVEILKSFSSYINNLKKYLADNF